MFFLLIFFFVQRITNSHWNSWSFSRKLLCSNLPWSNFYHHLMISSINIKKIVFIVINNLIKNKPLISCDKSFTIASLIINKTSDRNSCVISSNFWAPRKLKKKIYILNQHNNLKSSRNDLFLESWRVRLFHNSSRLERGKIFSHNFPSQSFSLVRFFEGVWSKKEKRGKFRKKFSVD
jgi:hypothetical protein